MKNTIYLLVLICIAEAAVIGLLYFGSLSNTSPVANENADPLSTEEDADLLTKEDWMEAIEDEMRNNQVSQGVIDPDYFGALVIKNTTVEEQVAFLQKMNPTSDLNYTALSQDELLIQLTIELLGKETHLRRGVYQSLNEGQKRFLLDIYSAQIDVSSESDIDQYFAPMLVDVTVPEAKMLPEDWAPDGEENL